MAKNFYEVLGIARNASEKDVRNAYRRLARKYHPDVNPDDKAAEARFKEINAAHEVLSDAEKRKKYDKYGDQWEHADQIEDMQRRQSPRGWARNGGPGFESGSGDFGNIFDSLFRQGGGRRSAPIPRRGQDIETAVEVSLEEAFRGTSRTLTLQSQQACPTCQGSGEVAGTICQACNGMGAVARPRRLEVRVPPGVKTGSRVRVAGEGRPGTAGGPSGDLFLVLTVADHTRFERKGDNLTFEINVPLTDAILGGEVEVQTLDSRLALRIPELTQNGRQIRLAGKGMPLLNDPTRRGDLFVRVRVQLPETLSPEERRLFEQLRELEHTSVPG